MEEKASGLKLWLAFTSADKCVLCALLPLFWFLFVGPPQESGHTDELNLLAHGSFRALKAPEPLCWRQVANADGLTVAAAEMVFWKGTADIKDTICEKKSC